MYNRAVECAKEAPRPKTYRYENVVFKVGTFYSQQGDTLKSILERTIKREAMAMLQSKKVQKLEM